MSSPSNILIFGDCFLLKALSKAQKHQVPSNLLFSSTCVSFSSTVSGPRDSQTHVRLPSPFPACLGHRETEQRSQQKVQYLKISNQADYFFVFLLPGVASDFVYFSYMLPFWVTLFLLSKAGAGDRQYHPALYSQSGRTMCRSSPDLHSALFRQLVILATFFSVPPCTRQWLVSHLYLMD